MSAGSPQGKEPSPRRVVSIRQPWVPQVAPVSLGCPVVTTSAPVVLIAEELAPSVLEVLGGEVEIRHVDGADRAALLPALADASAVMIRSATQIDAEALAAAPELKVVARAGIGLDNVDVATATERGVMVVNAPMSNIVSAAEHAVALLLAAARHIPAADASLRAGEWRRSTFTGVEVAFGSVGIVDQIKNGVAEVRVKSLRLREKLDNLELVEATAPKLQPGKLEKLRRSAATETHLAADDKAQSELNVIGQTTDEAVDAVDKFLDEASLASLSKVRIIHGHGTGALRRAIGALLDGHPHVSRFLPAPPDQGGAGATLVELRQ